MSYGALLPCVQHEALPPLSAALRLSRKTPKCRRNQYCLPCAADSRGGSDIFRFLMDMNRKENRGDRPFFLTGVKYRRKITDGKDEKGQPMCIRSHMGCPFFSMNLPAAVC